jgi:hypothetical protein
MTAFAVTLTSAALLPLHGMTRLLLWAVIAVAAPYLWYLAYALKDASAKTPDGVTLQFGTLRPFWGGSSVPYAKGAANLRRIEVRNPQDLSVVQLKAIKLLIWVSILRVLLGALTVFVYGEPHSQAMRFIGLAHWKEPNLGVPRLHETLQLAAVPVLVAWESLIAYFVQLQLDLTVTGGLVIACCRMAGFYALRNTYRPLQSQTLAEFWNRYYYYFKELLVDIFFFPAFTRYFKRHQRLRTFAATMAAATVGNMLYHFFLDYQYVAEMGLWRALRGFESYAFYCTVLGLGIGISQLRGHGKQRLGDDAPWWRRARATAGVLSFFCLAQVFTQESTPYGLGHYLRFFLRLFLIPV